MFDLPVEQFSSQATGSSHDVVPGDFSAIPSSQTLHLYVNPTG